jgi:hypothetical protein
MLPSLVLLIPLAKSAQAATITFDWGTAPEATDFHGQASASTTVDGVELSATLVGGTAFSTAAGGLGASGVGSPTNFDGEGGFTFNFDTAGTLTSITLVSLGGINANLVTPNDGVHNYNASFSGETYAFLAGQNFTFQHLGGAYRVQTVVIEVEDTEAVPEPGTVLLAGIGMLALGACWAGKRMRCAE